MNHDSYADEFLRGILQDAETIAVVGASPNPARPSYGVQAFLRRRGYRLFPINPGHVGQEIMGARVYASLADVPEPIDIVNVFRRSDALDALVDEILTLPTLPKAIWAQLGVRDDRAAQKAEARGIKVVMNRCPAIEAPRLGL